MEVGLPEPEAKALARRLLEMWLDNLAVVHARYVARCVYNRASACKDAANASFRRVSTLDVDDALSTLPPPLLPRLPGTTCVAAAGASTR
jgi:hypothetical protein